MHYSTFVFFFFFQAEDGIRDLIVTGVQTCALPISLRVSSALSEKGAYPGEYDDALLQSRELVGGEGRVGRHVCPRHRGQVGRGFHASFCSATSDDSSIAWAQANGNAVSRPYAFRGRVVCRGSLRPAVFIHKCPNRHQR